MGIVASAGRPTPSSLWPLRPSSPRIIQRSSQTIWEIWALQSVLGLPRGLLSDGRKGGVLSKWPNHPSWLLSMWKSSFLHLPPSRPSTLFLLRSIPSDLQEQIFIPAASHVAVNASDRPGGQVMSDKRLSLALTVMTGYFERVKLEELQELRFSTFYCLSFVHRSAKQPQCTQTSQGWWVTCPRVEQAISQMKNNV